MRYALAYHSVNDPHPGLEMLEIRDPLSVTAVVTEHFRRTSDLTPTYVTVYVNNIDDGYFVFSLTGRQPVTRNDDVTEEAITYYCTMKKVN